MLQKHDYRAKIYTATCNCLVLHRPALSDGCRHTVWISSILSRPVADLIHLGDHISSCSSNHFANQLAVQLVLAFHFCSSASEPQMSAVQRQLCYAFWCLLILWYTLTVASFNLLFYSSSCLGWVLAGIGSYCANKVNRAIYSL